MTEIPCPRPCSAKLVCRRVTRQGRTYRCTKVLAEALGLTPSAVYQSLHRHGDAEHCGHVPRGRKGGPRKPVAVGPHKWPTISAMAKDLGVSRRQLAINLKAAPDRVLALVMERKN